MWSQRPLVSTSRYSIFLTLEVRDEGKVPGTLLLQKRGGALLCVRQEAGPLASSVSSQYRDQEHLLPLGHCYVTLGKLLGWVAHSFTINEY